MDVSTMALKCIPVCTGVYNNTAFSMDPSLEAFSGNPADGSVAVLVFQLTAFTRYLNELFLSY